MQITIIKTGADLEGPLGGSVKPPFNIKILFSWEILNKRDNFGIP